MSEVRNPPRAIVRALLWVVLGLLAAVLTFLAVSPELVGADPGRAFELVALVLVAAIPGVVLLIWAALRRHRLGLDDLEGHDGPRSGHHADPTHDRER